MDTLVSWGPAGIFLCALLDGAGVPNPGGMDALLLLLTIADPSKAYWSAAAAIAGSLLGGMILFYIARKGGQAYIEKHTQGRRGERFKAWFHRYGLLTVFIPALVPIPMPLKVFVVCSGALGVRPISFFIVMLLARIPRYFGLAYLGSELGHGALPWLKSHKWQLVGFAAALFAFLFLLTWIVDRMRHKRPI